MTWISLDGLKFNGNYHFLRPRMDGPSMKDGRQWMGTYCASDNYFVKSTFQCRIMMKVETAELLKWMWRNQKDDENKEEYSVFLTSHLRKKMFPQEKDIKGVEDC